MSNKQNFLPGFLLGVAAGAVVTVFLQGEKGKNFVKNAKSSLKDASEDLKSGIENIDETIEKWVSKGKNLVNEIKGKNKTDSRYDLEDIFS